MQTCSTEAQAHIQAQVAVMTLEETQIMYAAAAARLMKMCMLGRVKLASDDEVQEALQAVEMMVRIEGRQGGGGWWFRAKRRPQLMAEAIREAGQQSIPAEWLAEWQ